MSQHTDSTAQSIFTGASDWHNNACLNFMPESSCLYGYIAGYRIAADSLAAQVIEDRGYQDALVYPIMFLYRHYIELCLKYIIHTGRKLLTDERVSRTGHKIDEIWADAKGIIREISSSEDTEEMEFTDRVIKEWGAADPSSTAFRYPKDKEGNNSIPANITHINLRQLRQRMGKVGDFLESVCSCIDADLECERDLAYYYGE